MFTQTQLINPPAEAQWRETITNNLKSSGFDVTDWTEGSLQQLMLQTVSVVAEQLGYMISDAYKLRLLQRTTGSVGNSSGAALDALSDSHFDNQRFQSKPAIGTWVVSASAGIGPNTFTTGELIASTLSTNGNTIVFHNDADVTVPEGGIATVAAISEVESAEASVPINSTWNVQSAAGYTITNPPVSGSTWLSQNGVTTESDYSLTQRNVTKWSTLVTSEIIEGRVESIVRNASSGSITTIAIDDTQSGGPFTVVVDCANEIQHVDPDPVTIAAVQASFFNGANLITLRPAADWQIMYAYTVPNSQQFAGFNVYVQSQLNTPQMVELIENTLDAYIHQIPMGAYSYGNYNHVVSAALLSKVIMNINGVQLAYAIQYGGAPLGDEFINTAYSNVAKTKVVAPSFSGYTWNLNMIPVVV